MQEDASYFQPNFLFFLSLPKHVKYTAEQSIDQTEIYRQCWVEGDTLLPYLHSLIYLQFHSSIFLKFILNMKLEIISLYVFTLVLEILFLLNSVFLN